MPASRPLIQALSREGRGLLWCRHEETLSPGGRGQGEGGSATAGALCGSAARLRGPASATGRGYQIRGLDPVAVPLAGGAHGRHRH